MGMDKGETTYEEEHVQLFDKHLLGREDLGRVLILRLS